MAINGKDKKKKQKEAEEEEGKEEEQAWSPGGGEQERRKAPRRHEARRCAHAVGHQELVSLGRWEEQPEAEGGEAEALPEAWPLRAEACRVDRAERLRQLLLAALPLQPVAT